MSNHLLRVLLILLLTFSMNAFAQTGSVKGRVVDEKGNGIVGAEILERQIMSGTVSDTTGRFLLLGLPRGSQTLRITSDGYKPETVDVVVRSDSTISVEVRLVLDSMPKPEANQHHDGNLLDLRSHGSVKGRVVDSQTKRPVQCHKIELLRNGLRDTTLPDENGEFMFTNVNAGQYTIAVLSSGYRNDEISIDVIADSVTHVTIELERIRVVHPIEMACWPKKICEYSEPFIIAPKYCTLVGSVREERTKQPIPFAVVEASYSFTDSIGDKWTGLCTSVFTDSLGRFVIPNRHPGEYRLMISKRGYESEVVRDSVITKADSLYRFELILHRQ